MGDTLTTLFLSLAVCNGVPFMAAAAKDPSVSFKNCACWTADDNRTLNCQENSPLVAENIANEAQQMVLANNVRVVELEYQPYSKTTSRLDLSHGQITTIPATSFVCFSKLNELVVTHNAITDIDPLAFAGLEHLIALGLEHNELTWLDPHTFLHPTLGKLQVINLAFNKLYELDAWFLILPATSFSNCSLTVNISNNLIGELVNTLNLSVSQVDDHPCLHLDIRTNNLSSATDVDVRSVYKMNNCTQLFKLRHVKIDMHQNPFHCDCHMYDLVHCMTPFLEKFESHPDMYLKNVMCSSPPEASGHVVTSLSNEQFYCGAQSDCPTECICRWTPGNSTVIVTCHGKPLKELPERVPSAANIHLRLRDTDISELTNRYYLKNVTILDIGWSKLTSLNHDLLSWMPSLDTLLAGNNDIRSISPEFNLTRLAHFDLCGNPLICDCHLIPFQTELVRYSNTTHITHSADCIRCPDGQPLTEKDPSALNCDRRRQNNMTILGHCFGVLLILMVIGTIVGIVYKAYSYKLQMFLLGYFSLPLVLPFRSENSEITWSRDVGILAHNLDGSYLARLKDTGKKLRPRYKIYTSDDLEPFQYELDIVKELMQCKSVLAIITPNFLQDNNCIFYFRTLFNHMLRDPSNIRLIPVLTADDKHLFSNRSEDSNIKCYTSLFPKIDYTEDEQNLKTLMENVLPGPIGFVDYD